MINVEAGMIINHPIEDVFAFVANLENLPQWDTDFQEAKRVASTPDGVGATYQCVLKYTGKNATQKVETTEYAVNKKITYESEPTRIAKARISIHFESVADGTKITSQRALAMAYPSFSGYGVLHVQLAGTSAHLFCLSLHAYTRSPRRRDAEIPRRARP